MFLVRRRERGCRDGQRNSAAAGHFVVAGLQARVRFGTLRPQGAAERGLKPATTLPIPNPTERRSRSRLQEELGNCAEYCARIGARPVDGRIGDIL